MERVIKNIVFWGEDAFSNVVLTSLIQAGYNVKMVVTPLYDNLIYKRLEMTCTRNGIEFIREKPINSKCPKFEVIANLEVESVVNTFAVIIHLKLSHYGNDRLRKRV